MKYLYTVLVLMLPLLGISQVFDKTVEAINTNNVELLDPFLDSSVDITFVDDHKVLAKKKAIQEIKQFLLGQGSISARKRHSGSSRENSSNYKVLELTTTIAKYRVFVYTEMVREKRLIKELRFDKI